MTTHQCIIQQLLNGRAIFNFHHCIVHIKSLVGGVAGHVAKVGAGDRSALEGGGGAQDSAASTDTLIHHRSQALYSRQQSDTGYTCQPAIARQSAVNDALVSPTKRQAPEPVWQLWHYSSSPP